MPSWCICLTFKNEAPDSLSLKPGRHDDGDVHTFDASSGLHVWGVRRYQYQYQYHYQKSALSVADG